MMKKVFLFATLCLLMLALLCSCITPVSHNKHNDGKDSSENDPDSDNGTPGENGNTQDSPSGTLPDGSSDILPGGGSSGGGIIDGDPSVSDIHWDLK